MIILETKKALTTALHITGATMIAVGGVAISYLCAYGLIAPFREEKLRERISTARKRGRAEGERAARPESYEAGLNAGKRTGYKAGRQEGYDAGYLDAARGDVYRGSSPVVLEELGLDPDEHARQLAEKEAAEARAKVQEDWDILEKIFSKKPDIKLGDPRVQPPQPLDLEEAAVTGDNPVEEAMSIKDLSDGANLMEEIRRDWRETIKLCEDTGRSSPMWDMLARTCRKLKAFQEAQGPHLRPTDEKPKVDMKLLDSVRAHMAYDIAEMVGEEVPTEDLFAVQAAQRAAEEGQGTAQETSAAPGPEQGPAGEGPNLQTGWDNPV